MQDITNGRCGWCGTDELYVKYHDEEWGKTVTLPFAMPICKLPGLSTTI